jgi:hypothetical protein
VGAGVLRVPTPAIRRGEVVIARGISCCNKACWSVRP